MFIRPIEMIKFKDQGNFWIFLLSQTYNKPEIRQNFIAAKTLQNYISLPNFTLSSTLQFNVKFRSF